MVGEIGHMRLCEHGPVGYGKSGSFEGFCSGGGIAQLAVTENLEQLQAGKTTTLCRSKNDLQSISAKDFFQAARDGDSVSLELCAAVADYLGRGLSVIIDFLNPEVIIIASIFIRTNDLLWPAAQKVIERECLPLTKSVCRVVPAELGENLGDFAAIAVAVNRVDEGAYEHDKA